MKQENYVGFNSLIKNNIIWKGNLYDRLELALKDFTVKVNNTKINKRGG